MGPMVILVIVLVAVVTASLGAAWGQYMDLRRRTAAMEVVKAAYAAGREPPAAILDDLAGASDRSSPWGAVIAFTALAVGFWIAYARMGSEDAQTAFMVVAATMTVTAAGLFVLAIAGRRKRGQRVGDGR